MRFQRRVGRKDAFHRTAVAQEFLRQMDALAEKQPPARAFCALPQPHDGFDGFICP